jgi:hypothetical protein
LTDPTAEEVLEFLIGWQCPNGWQCSQSDSNGLIVTKFETHCEGDVRIVWEKEANGKLRFHLVDISRQ